MTTELQKIPYVNGVPGTGQESISWIRNGDRLMGSSEPGGSDGNLNDSTAKVQANVVIVDSNTKILAQDVSKNEVDIQNIYTILDQGSNTDLIQRVSKNETDIIEVEQRLSQDELTTAELVNALSGFNERIGVKDAADTTARSLSEDTFFIRKRLGNKVGENINGEVDISVTEPTGIFKNIDDTITQVNENQRDIEVLQQEVANADIGSLTQSVAKIRLELGSSPTETTPDVYTRLNANDVHSAETDTKIIDIQNRIGTGNVKQDIDQLKVDVDTLQSGLETADNNITLLTNDIKNPVTGLEKRISTVETSVDNLTAVVLDPDTGLKKQVADIDAEIGDINTPTSINGKINSVQSQAQTNSSAIQDMQIDVIDLNDFKANQIIKNDSQTIINDHAILTTSNLSYDLNTPDAVFINESANLPMTYFKSKQVESIGNVTLSPTGDNIVLIADANDNARVKGLTIDGKGNGQLDAGLLIFNQSKNFVIEDVVLKNGGTPGESSPKGVNAIGVATTAFPTGGKSTGHLNRITTYNFTKAPINWTTYAEEGSLSFSNFYDNVGNGYCPAIQMNGGIRFKSVFNHVERTEGAGTTIATVGTTPPIAARECLSFGNSYYDIGTLGSSNAERYSIQIAQNFGATDTQDFIVSHEYTKNAVGGFARMTNGSKSANFSNNMMRTVGIPFSLASAEDVCITDNVIEDYNTGNLTIGAFLLNGCKRVYINGGTISTTKANSYLLSSTTGVNTGVRVKDVHIKDESIGIMANSHYQYFSDTTIEVKRKYNVANATTKQLFLAGLIAGRSLRIELKVYGMNGAQYIDYHGQILATSTDGTTCTVMNNTVVKNIKTAGINDIIVDTTGNNLRIQFTNNFGSAINLMCDYNIYIV